MSALVTGAVFRKPSRRYLTEDQVRPAWGCPDEPETLVRLVSSAAPPPEPEVQLSMSDADPWFDEPLAQLAEVFNLNADWDGYGAKRVSQRTLRPAVDLLLAVHEAGLRAPQVVPTNAGGLGIEWDDGNLAVTLEIDREGRLQASAIERSTDSAMSFPFTLQDARWTSLSDRLREPS